MNILQIDRLSKSFGERILFKDISFGLAKGQKTALIARNGAGKTTLMRMLMGKESPDSGEITFRKDVVIGYLEQHSHFDTEKSIRDCVFGGSHPALRVIADYEELANIEERNEVQEVELQMLIRQIDDLQAWGTEAKIHEILSRLEITDLTQRVGSLSGGQRKRIALAAVLVLEPEILILDEPTNHLDVEMIEWLERYFKQSELSLLMVTHDRYFLDQVCDDIVEIDQFSVQRYKGNYAYYLEKKAHQIGVLNSETEKARNTYTRELEWMRRMPKARGTKARARIDQFYEIKEVASRKISNEQVQLDVKMNRLGGKILELIKISKSFGDRKCVDSFTYTFKRGEKIGIVGKNGTGKSTLLKLITGELTPESGKIIFGETVVMGYYAQEEHKIDPEKRVLEVVKDVAEVIPLSNGTNLTAAQLLQRFLFSNDMHYTHVSKLSGGELRRLYLLTILMKNPNFLILDEPTNDLDLQTLGVLQDFLENFNGCVLIVTHDRFFLDNLADHLFVFEGEGLISDFNGNYTDYMLSRMEEKSEKKEKSKIETPVKQVQEATVKRKASFKETHELKQLDEAIPALEAKIAVLTEKLQQCSNHIEMQQISTEIQELNQNLEMKTNRWLELSDLVSQL